MEFHKLFKEKIISIKKIDKGFSLDKKYIVNGKYIVRVINLDRFDQFQEAFRVQKAFEKVARCQKAIKLIKNKDYGYYITEYIKGQDGLEVIESFSNDKQYKLGLTVAKDIVKFHKAYPITDFDMKQHLDNYLNRKISLVLEYNVEEFLPEIHNIIELVKSKIHHLYSLQAVQTHADYHLFNMIFDHGEYKGVVDFERVRPGPFLTDFRNNTPHNSKISPYFASGYIDGYLEEINIDNFFLMYNIYDLLLTIAAIPWVMKFDSNNIDRSVEIIKTIYEQRDNLSTSPSWYVGKF
jgi:aminoglycoside phosphotransferase (APT) family kinase protein